MDPLIQYGQTSDGVSIAFWAMGEGKALVAMPSMPWSHLQLEWQIPEIRDWYEGLARGRQLVRYDGRGFGLSQRDVDSQAIDDQLLDLVAVVERLGLETFDLYAGLHSGPVAVEYAARNPERVENLVLFCSYPDGYEFAQSPLTQASRPIIDQDWDFYTELVARLLLGWSEPEAAHRFARLVHECTTPEMARTSLAATTEFDVTSRLADVRCPTLVLHRREVGIGRFEQAQALAAGIPGARLSVLEGTTVAPYLGDATEVIHEIDMFLGGGASTVSEETPKGAGQLRTILFTDVEGSTSLTQELGDTRVRDLLKAHEELVRDELRTHRGTEIKAMGDGFMASFGSAVGAVECAIAIQRRFAARNETQAHRIRLRIGLNAGEPIEEDDDLYGTAVIAAARIAAHADGDEIYVSDVVRQLVAGKGFDFGDKGEVELRGFDDPMRVHEVRWDKDLGATSA
ncbi:MAG: alpha/beta fold hydrolase [Acidimicrobiia bacterium]